MSTLLSAHNLSKAFSSQVLFENISFTLHQGDHVGLIGPNGCGKSTLLKILLDLESADTGHICKRQGLRLGYSSQSADFPAISLEDVMMQAPSTCSKEERLQRARSLLSRAYFEDFDILASTLSGGQKKRLDIIRAFMDEPSMLLFDEPTNHLDLDGILWLEKFLERESTPYLIVSHDRCFLDKLVNRVIEIQRCYPQGLLSHHGNLSTFIEHRNQFLQAQFERERSLRGTAREELEWLRRSPKARTCKSQARVQKAHELLGDLQELKQRNKINRLDVEFTASERETRNLLVATNLTKSLGGKTLFKGLELKLSPGTRLGIVGRNGTGKTTLLKLLGGIISADLGTIKYADNLKIIYFDQHREQIPLHLTLKEALCPNGDLVNYRGQSIHVNGWAKRFLFSPDKLQMPLKYLSGGERARIQIAKLMLESADILFLDEPTNDLDMDTLEVIEQSLSDFPGAVVMISHDRWLMNSLCTQLIGLGLQETPCFFADYKKWEQALESISSKRCENSKTVSKKVQEKPIKRKLSYQEQRELSQMQESIEKIEKQLEEIHNDLQDPSCDATKSLDLYKKFGEQQQKLDDSYVRWQELMDLS